MVAQVRKTVWEIIKHRCRFVILSNGVNFVRSKPFHRQEIARPESLPVFLVPLRYIELVKAVVDAYTFG